MTGTNVVDGVDSTTAGGIFGDLSTEDPDHKYISVKLRGILPDSGTFQVKQMNPALEVWETDQYIHKEGSNWVKERSYTGDPTDTDFWLVLREGDPTVIVVVTPDSGEAVTYTINSTWTTGE